MSSRCLQGIIRPVRSFQRAAKKLPNLMQLQVSFYMQFVSYGCSFLSAAVSLQHMVFRICGNCMQTLETVSQ